MPPHALRISGSYMGSLFSQPPQAPLKRPRASSAPCENEAARQRKRSRSNPSSSLMNEKVLEQCEDEEVDAIHMGKGKEKELLQSNDHAVVARGVSAAVIEELAQELKCGCCTELCYNPVIVNPCQHYFCGSCCILWIRNGGTNCPACRGVSTSVTPSRVLQSMIDLLLRSDPSRARTENECAQADQVYRVGTALRLPTPRLMTPEPNLEPPNDNFARPCPTCLAGNAYGWRCPIPIQDPAIDPENAFDLDDGTPTGHAFCGNCDQLHNLLAPTSTKCDFCQVSFCGVGIQGRCCALGLNSQQPHGMSDLPDIILSGAIYESFQGNSVEVDIMVDYLRANDITLRGVYKEIIAHTLQQPNSFMLLIDMGIFDDLHGVSGGDDPDPTSPRRRICRLCAAQVLIHGFKDWWIRERKNGNLPDEVMSRKDCPQGSVCIKQNDPAHCKEFNHIIASVAALVNNPPAPASSIHNASAPLTAPQRLGLIFHSPEVDLPPPSPPPHDRHLPVAPSSTVHPSTQAVFDDPFNVRMISRSGEGPNGPQSNNAGPSNDRPNGAELAHSHPEPTSAVVLPMEAMSMASDTLASMTEDVVMANSGIVDAGEAHALPRGGSVQPVFGEEMAELLASKTSSSRTQTLPLLPSI